MKNIFLNNNYCFFSINRVLGVLVYMNFGPVSDCQEKIMPIAKDLGCS
jgi:hypothetical protein